MVSSKVSMFKGLVPNWLLDILIYYWIGWVFKRADTTI